MPRIEVHGKHFTRGGVPFRFRGVTYGTFAPRDDGHRYPSPPVVERDFRAMAQAGFTVVRTYTVPPDDVLEAARAHGLAVLAGVFFPDWRYVVGVNRAAEREVVGAAQQTVREAAERLAGRDEVLALCLGNEVPADVVRWMGTGRVTRMLQRLTDTARAVDPEMLLTYGNYPTSEYLPLGFLDFVTFNVFLERREDLRRYVTRLHHLAGDRPLVLGEIGLHAGDGEPDGEGEKRQASALDWQLEVALERGVAGTCIFSWTDEWHVGDHPVEEWRFGLTRADRSPRPSLDVATRWNDATVRDVTSHWPTLSVVICAYNEERYIDECLRHTCALDYPQLEIIVVDDGSTDATAEIVRRHPRARLVSVAHGGLSNARNAGYAAASGTVVAYLDADAYPSAEWPYYLALGFDSPTVGGVGGPNVPPVDDPVGAHRVARAPGGPVYVLISDDRAEHVPGCNMAFLKEVLVETGGCDPVYTSAGDDVDLCWKVLDRGWQIGFHPAALVWHHRRPDARAYLRQQRGYGRAEALVAARHPDRFTPLGTARWHGRIYDSFAPAALRARIYRGPFGAAGYQSVYQGGGHLLDLAHQIGVPLAVPALLLAPFGVLQPLLALPGVVALVGLLGLGLVDAARARPPRGARTGELRFRAGVAALHLAQPLVRTWGRLWHGRSARRTVSAAVELLGPAVPATGGALVLPADRQRAAIAADVIAVLRRGGLRVVGPTGWEDYDGVVRGSATIDGLLVTSAHPEGCVQLRTRLRLRTRSLLVAVLAIAIVAGLAPLVAAAMAAVVVTDVLVGLRRVGPTVRRLISAAARPRTLKA